MGPCTRDRNVYEPHCTFSVSRIIGHHLSHVSSSLSLHQTQHSRTSTQQIYTKTATLATPFRYQQPCSSDAPSSSLPSQPSQAPNPPSTQPKYAPSSLPFPYPISQLITPIGSQSRLRPRIVPHRHKNRTRLQRRQRGLRHCRPLRCARPDRKRPSGMDQLCVYCYCSADVVCCAP